MMESLEKRCRDRINEAKDRARPGESISFPQLQKDELSLYVYLVAERAEGRVRLVSL